LNAPRARVRRNAPPCAAWPKLPPEQREVIVLKIWHEYTFEKIGELLELSPNTVAGRYRYGLQKLRACLNGENYESLESTGEATALLTPRPPSPSLKARLFGEPLSKPPPTAPRTGRPDAATAREDHSRPEAWHWLAPAKARSQMTNAPG